MSDAPRALRAVRRPGALRAQAGVAALLTLSLTLSGCSLWPRKSVARATPAAPPGPQTYVAPAHVPLGRILSHDADAKVALVEFSPFAKVPADLAGRALIARHPETLEPTARLVASTRRAGTILGVYVVEGTPSPDDEVVLSPAP